MNREDLELEKMKWDIESLKIQIERDKKYTNQPYVDEICGKQEMLRRNIECLVNVKKNALDVNELILKAVKNLEIGI